MTVLTVKVANLSPGLTFTVAGTVAKCRSLESFTDIPLAGAGPLSATVPVEEAPPLTVVGLRLKAMRVGGVTVSVVVFVTDPLVAVMVTSSCSATVVVVTLNVASLCPGSTVTDFGTVTAELSLERETTRPFVPASPVRVTVPVVGILPSTSAGSTLTSTRVGGVIVRSADLETPSCVTVMVAVVLSSTMLVVMLNVADVVPAGTSTFAGHAS